MGLGKSIAVGIVVGGSAAAIGIFAVKPYLEAREKDAEDRKREEEENLVLVTLVPDGTIYYEDIRCTRIMVRLNWLLTGRPVVRQTIHQSSTGVTFINTHECGDLKGKRIDSTDAKGQVAFHVAGRPSQIYVKVFEKTALIGIPEVLLVPVS